MFVSWAEKVQSHSIKKRDILAKQPCKKVSIICTKGHLTFEKLHLFRFFFLKDMEMKKFPLY